MCAASIRTGFMAEAWNPMRLERARRQLADGKKAPAIRVIGFRLGRAVLYAPEDGIHRTVAAREAGQEIKARIQGQYRVSPNAFLIAHGCLWRANNGRGVDELRDDRVRAALIALGVPAR
jgi:hypothetical protein